MVKNFCTPALEYDRDAPAAHQADENMANTFSTHSVMMRLNGLDGYLDDCLERINRVTGTLLFCSDGIPFEKSFETESKIWMFWASLSGFTNIKYASYTISPNAHPPPYMINRCPQMVFEYEYYPANGEHWVQYRPTLLNGRHIVDVVRAVCGPADISEAELDIIRTEATQMADYLSAEVWGEVAEYEGVWHTSWFSNSITAQMGA